MEGDGGGGDGTGGGASPVAGCARAAVGRRVCVCVEIVEGARSDGGVRRMKAKGGRSSLVWGGDGVFTKAAEVVTGGAVGAQLQNWHLPPA